jgi:hypothetical protein
MQQQLLTSAGGANGCMGIIACALCMCYVGMQFTRCKLSLHVYKSTTTFFNEINKYDIDIRDSVCVNNATLLLPRISPKTGIFRRFSLYIINLAVAGRILQYCTLYSIYCTVDSKTVTCDLRVDRVPGFLSFRPNWLPRPSPASECCPPPLWFQGGHTR